MSSPSALDPSPCRPKPTRADKLVVGNRSSHIECEEKSSIPGFLYWGDVTLSISIIQMTVAANQLLLCGSK